jgi:putative ABC transport system substrate-binding protein
MRRREFVTALGGATAAWPFAARAQQPARPTIGYLSFPAIEARPHLVIAFRKGLGAEGFVEGQNVMIEYRSADGKADQLPELAADLVRRRVAVIAATGGPPAALAAKRATQSIPIVFTTGADPVQLGLVPSINRPGGNITGVYFLLTELVAKRLELLHELAPRIVRLAVLVNPANASEAEPTVRNATAAGRALGIEIQAFNASSSGEIDAAFAAMVSWRADAVFIGPDPFFATRNPQFFALAARHALLVSYTNREPSEDDGLISYGPNRADDYAQVGVYVGRILKGDKPGDLPVMQPTKYELVINLKTARALGLTVPPALIARADVVIE